MQHLLDTYGNLLVPAAVALLVVIVLIKIVIALEHAVLRMATAALTILVLGTGIIVGASAIGRLNSIQTAAATAARSIAKPNSNGIVRATDLQQALQGNAQKALVSVGLNPAYLHIRVTCAAAGATLHLRYSDASFLYGLLSHQEVSAPLPSNVRCV